MLTTGFLVTSAVYADKMQNAVKTDDSVASFYSNYNIISQGTPVLNNDIACVINDTVYENNAASSDAAGGEILLKTIDETASAPTTYVYNTASTTPEEFNGILIEEGANFAINDVTFKDLQASIVNEGNLTVMNSVFDGSNTYGSAVYNKGSFYSDPTTYENRTAEDGAGIYNDYEATAVVQGDIFRNNTADNRGGGIYSEGALTVEEDDDGNRPSFTSNKAVRGGAIYSSGKTSIKNSEFRANKATVEGGAIYVASGDDQVFEGNTFTENEAANNGGAIYNENFLKIQTTEYGEGTTFERNTAKRGGAVYTDYSGYTNIFGTAFENNTAEQTGGAIHSFGTVKIQSDDYNQSTFNENTAVQGGAIFNQGDLNIDGERYEIEFRSNSTTAGDNINNGGGAIYNAAGGLAKIKDAIFEDNTDYLGSNSDGGGAIANIGNYEDYGDGNYNIQEAYLNLESSSITNNTASKGGGISNIYASATIKDTNINDNRAVGATSAGGAIYSGFGSSLEITDGSTIKDNSSAYQGGGIYNEGTLTVSDSQITDNTSATGGGIYHAGAGEVRIENSTIQGNSAEKAGGIASVGSEEQSGKIYISDTAFLKNTATAGNGGAIYLSNAGDLDVINSQFGDGYTRNSNTATGSGGAIYAENSNVSGNGAEFNVNSSANDGGAIYLSNGSLRLTNAQFNANKTTSANASGGAIYLSDSTLNITPGENKTSFSGNSTASNGGAIYLSGENSGLNINDAEFIQNTSAKGGAINISGGNNQNSEIRSTAFGSSQKGNTASVHGGAIKTDSNLTIISSSFDSNGTTQNNTSNDEYGGGAIFADGADEVNILSSTFDDNYSAGNGGAILTKNNSGNDSFINITDSTFSSNTAQDGGAIYNTVKTVIADTNFYGNEASGKGGAIYNAASGDLYVIANAGSTMFNGNTANGDFNAIHNLGTMTLISSGGNFLTIADDITGEYGTIYINDLSNVFEYKAVDDMGNIVTKTIDNNGGIVTIGANLSGNDIKVQGGELVNYGIIYGDIENNARFVNSNTVESGYNIINSAGSTVVNNNGSTMKAVIQNSGFLENGGLIATESELNNSEGSKLVNFDDGTIAANINNAGTVENYGNITSDSIINNNKGARFFNGDRGVINGVINNNMVDEIGGDFINNGEINADINNYGSFSNNGKIRAGNLITNESSGTFSHIAGSINAEVINNGLFNNMAQLTGDVTNNLNSQFYNNKDASIGNITNYGDVFTFANNIGVGENKNVLNDGTIFIRGGTTIAEIKNATEGVTSGMVAISPKEFSDVKLNNKIINNNIYLMSGTLDLVGISDTEGNIDLSDATSLMSGPGKISVQDSKTADINLNNIITSQYALNVAIDTDIKNDISDKLYGSFVNEDERHISISDINISQSSTDPFTEKDIAVADPGIGDTVIVGNARITNNRTGKDLLLSTRYDSTLGELLHVYTRDDLKVTEAIVSELNDRAYSMHEGEALANSGGAITMTGDRLTISGDVDATNNYYVISSAIQGNDGIIIQTDKSLSLFNLGMKGFGKAIHNSEGGTLTLKNILFSNNATDIFNNGTVIFEGTTTNNGTITGGSETSRLEIRQELINKGNINGNNIDIGSEGSLITSASKINDKDGNIDNLGTLKLTTGTLTNTVMGGGNTAIEVQSEGDVVYFNSKVSQTIDVISGMLETSADNIGGTVNNYVQNGLNLTGGTLFHNILETGTTKINGIVTIDPSATVSQKINVLTGSLSAQGESLLDDVNNIAELNLAGGTFRQNITSDGGNTGITNLLNNAIVEGKSITQNKVYIDSGSENTVTNRSNIYANVINLSDSTLDSVDGKIFGSVINNSDAKIKVRAHNIAKDSASTISNAGSIQFVGGDLTKSIDGYNDGSGMKYGDLTAVAESEPLFIGNGQNSITINQDSLNIYSPVEIKAKVNTNVNTLVVNSDLVNKAEINVNEGINTNSNINNAGTIKLKGTNHVNSGIIFGEGSLVIGDGTTVSKFKNENTVSNSITNNILINQNAELETNASALSDSNGIINHGALLLDNGELNSSVSGDGETNIKNNVNVNAKISQGINVLEESSLSANADYIDANVSNAGTVILTDGSLGTSAKNITISTATGATDSSTKISGGSVFITNGSKINQDVYIDSGSLDTEAAALGGTVTVNGGSFNLLDGTFSNKVTNNGGDINNYGTIADIDLEGGNVYNDNNITDIHNYSGYVHNYADGVITNLNNENHDANAVENGGQIVNLDNSGYVYNYYDNKTGKITGTLNNVEGALFVTDASGFTSTSNIKNDGTLLFTGGTINKNIGSYSSSALGEVEINTDNTVKLSSQINDNKLVLTNGILDVTDLADTEGDIDLSGIHSIVGNYGTISFVDDKIGDIQLGNVDISGNDLFIAVDADIASGKADIISATNITRGNSLVINSINALSAPEVSEVSLLIAGENTKKYLSADGNKVIVDFDDNIGSYRFKYDSTSGNLLGTHADINNAIKSTIEHKTYTLDEDEAVNAVVSMRGSTLDVDGANNYIYAENSNYGINIGEEKTLSIKNTTISGFKTAITNSGTLNIKDSEFGGDNVVAINNLEGGVVYSDPTLYNAGVINAGTATFEGDRFDAIPSSANGSAIYNTGNLTIKSLTEGATTHRATFIDNYAKNGGAIYQEGTGSVSNIFDADFNNNWVNANGSKGGAILAEGGVVNLNSSTFEGNSADNGGAIYNTTRTVAANTNFVNNRAYASGGAVYNSSGAVFGIIADGQNVSMSGNLVGPEDAEEEDLVSNAIYNEGQLELINTGSDNKTLTISDKITGSNGVININSLDTINSYKVLNNTGEVTDKDLIAAGGKVVLEGDISGNEVNIFSGTVDSNGINIPGIVNYSGAEFNNNTVGTKIGTIGTVENYGTFKNNANSLVTTKLTNAGGAAINLGTIEAVDNTGGEVTNNGLINTLQNNSSVSNYGTVVSLADNTNGTITNYENGEITGDIINAGIIVSNAEKIGTASSAPLLNSGNIKLSGGTLTKNVDGITSGTPAVTTYGTITTVGETTLGDGTNNLSIRQDTLDIQADTTLSQNAQVVVDELKSSSTELLTNNGTIIVNDALSSTGNIENNNVLTLNGGTTSVPMVNSGAISGGGNLNVNGVLNNTNQIIGNDIIIAEDGRLITSADSISDKDHSIVNDGTLEFTSGSINESVVSSPGKTTGNIAISGDVDFADTTKSINQTINITTGTLTANGSNLVNTVNNSNTNGLVLTGGDLTQNVTGTGSTKIQTGDVTINDATKSISQGINIVSGSLSANANSIQGNVDNASVLNITGGSLNKTINDTQETKTGVTNVKGNTTLNSTITQKTVNVDSNNGSEGELVVTNNGTIDGEFVNEAYSKVVNIGNVTGNVINKENGSLSSKTDGFATDSTSTISNAGKLTLNTSGSLNKSIDGYDDGEGIKYGTLELTNGGSTGITIGYDDAGNITVKQEKLEVNTNSTLANNVDAEFNIVETSENQVLTNKGDLTVTDSISGAGKVTNNNNLNLYGEEVTLSSAIDGSGVVTIGDGSATTQKVTNTGNISGNDIVISSNGELVTSATNISDKDSQILNDGIVTLNAGTLNDNISGIGHTDIVTGSVSNNAQISQKLNVLSGTFTNNNSGTVTGDVDNAGIIDNTNGTISGGIVNRQNAQLITKSSGLTGTSDIKNDGTIIFNNTSDGTIAQNIGKNSAGGGIVEIKASEVVNPDESITYTKVSLASDKSITDNAIKLTSGKFDVTKKADIDGNIDVSTIGTKIIANGGTLNVQDGKTGTITLGDVDVTNTDLKVAIDVDLYGTGSGGIADKMTQTGTLTGPNTINISNLALVTDEFSKYPDKIQIADTTINGESISLGQTKIETPTTGSVMISTLTDENGTYISTGKKDLTYAIVSPENTKAYLMSEDEKIANPRLEGTSLSITADNNSIISESESKDEDGITIDNSGQTLTIYDAKIGSDTNGFDTFLDNTEGGVVNLENITFINNNTDVDNAGELNLTGTNTLSSSIENSGTISNSGTLNGGTVNNSGEVTNTGTITSSVDNSGVFVSSASRIQSQTVNNDGDLNLNAGADGNQGTLGSSVKVTGNGNVNVTDGIVSIVSTDFTQNKINTSNGATTNINSNVKVDEINNSGTTNINTKVTATSIKAEEGTINIVSGSDTKTSEKVGDADIIIYNGAKVSSSTDSDNFTVDNKVTGSNTATSRNSVLELKGNGDTQFDIDSQISDSTVLILNGQLYLPNENNMNNSNVHISDGASLNVMDGKTLAYNNTVFDDGANLQIDADIRTRKTDTFVNPTENGTEYLSDLNINGLDNTLKADTSINITTAAGLSPEKLEVTPELSEKIKEKYNNLITPIQKVHGEINQTPEGVVLNFTGGTDGGYPNFNPAVMAAPVAAQAGGYLVQLNSYDQAFENMDKYMLMPYKERQALKMKNKVAATSGNQIAFDDTTTQNENAGLWFRPYTSFEKVGLKNGPKVENNMYGSYFGGESQMKDLGHGWDGMWGAYIGYNGAHQNYDGVGIYENGGNIGLTGMVYKDNFFAGATANAGLMGAEASTMYGNETFGMFNTGVALKTGYNAELADGKFIIQPNVQTSYSMVDTFNYHNAADVNVHSGALHAITVEPGVKFIGNLPKGWQPYAGGSVVMSFMDKTNFTANDTTLPSLSVKPYAKYGVGVRKMWGDRLSGNLQCYVMNGGRNGFGMQGGFKWALGANSKKTDNDNTHSLATPKAATPNVSAQKSASPITIEQKGGSYIFSNQSSIDK